MYANKSQKYSYSSFAIGNFDRLVWISKEETITCYSKKRRTISFVSFSRVLFVFGAARRGECLDPVSGKEKCEGNRWFERNPGRVDFPRCSCTQVEREFVADWDCRNSDVTFYESFVRTFGKLQITNFGFKARQKRDRIDYRITFPSSSVIRRIRDLRSRSLPLCKW